LANVLSGYGTTVQLHAETFIGKAGVTSSTFRTIPDIPVAPFDLVVRRGRHPARTPRLQPWGLLTGAPARLRLRLSRCHRPSLLIGPVGPTWGTEEGPGSETGACASGSRVCGFGVLVLRIDDMILLPPSGVESDRRG
jgi:hypothetical protein